MFGGKGDWAGKAAVVELLPLVGRESNPLREGGDLVEAGLVVVLSKQDRLARNKSASLSKE